MSENERQLTRIIDSLRSELRETQRCYHEKTEEADRLRREVERLRREILVHNTNIRNGTRNELETLLSSLSESSLPGTQLNTVPHGMSHTNRGGVREWRTNHDGDEYHDLPEPEHDIRHYDAPDDNAVDQNTEYLTGTELDRMRPSLVTAITALRRYDYSMFPDLEDLHVTDPVSARSIASLRREKYELALVDLSAHNYNAARRHLRYIVQYILPANNTTQRNLRYVARPANRRTN